jgi:hypothetical protein
VVFDSDQVGTIGIKDPKVFISAYIRFTLPPIPNTIEMQSGLPKLFPRSFGPVDADCEIGKGLDVVGPPCHSVVSVSCAVEVE